MPTTALMFKQVKGRFRLIDVSYSDPYGDGKGYFTGTDTSNRPNDFPYASGPRCFVGKHADDELIPLGVILNWLHRLGILGKPLEKFWAVEDHLSSNT